jgi:hypothetical protein
LSVVDDGELPEQHHVQRLSTVLRVIRGVSMSIHEGWANRWTMCEVGDTMCRRMSGGRP